MNRRLLLVGSLRTLSRYRLRTFLMSIGVAVGVASLVAGRSLGTSAEQQIMGKVNRMFGPGTMLIFSHSRNGTGAPLKLADLETIGKRLDEVDR